MGMSSRASSQLGTYVSEGMWVVLSGKEEVMESPYLEKFVRAT